jgi:hypothetical protein
MHTTPCAPLQDGDVPIASERKTKEKDRYMNNKTNAIKNSV